MDLEKDENENKKHTYFQIWLFEVLKVNVLSVSKLLRTYQH